MPRIIQRQVFSQTDSGGILGRDGCGINTFKNTLLSLLLAGKHISSDEFHRLSNSKALVQAIYDSIKDTMIQKDAGGRDLIDISMPKLFEMVRMIQNGQINLAAHGITQVMVNKLNLDVDGKQDLTIVNASQYVEMGLFGAQEDLFVASTLAKLIHTKGAFTHAFAIGYDNSHWVSAVLHQNAQGEKTWEFMDSYQNQTLYTQNIIGKLNTIMNKNAKELKTYLTNAYDNSSDMIKRRFEYFFDPQTNKIIPGKKIDPMGNNVYYDATGFYTEQYRAEYIVSIKDRFIFMKNAGWLEKGVGEEELAKIKQLHAITEFMINNGDKHPEIKENLSTICSSLQEVITLNLATLKDNAPEPVAPESAQNKTIDFKKEKDSALQTTEAVHAVENDEPKSTPNLFARLVNSILKGIKEGFQAIVNFFSKK